MSQFPKPPSRPQHSNCLAPVSNDRTEKLPVYAREQVKHVWLVDPLLQTLEVLRLDGPSYRILGAWRAEAVVQCEPFEVLPIRLADLWSA